MNLSCQVGIGEVYRVYSQILLLLDLSAKYNFARIFEYPPDPIAARFIIPWEQVKNPCVDGDLLFTWKAFPHTAREMMGFRGSHLLLIGTNKLNPGIFFQKLYWKDPEIYLTLPELKILAEGVGLDIVESGYYDCPPWPDAPLGPYDSFHLPIPDRYIQKLMFFDDIPFKKVRSHHVYCLGIKK